MTSVWSIWASLLALFMITPPQAGSMEFTLVGSIPGPAESIRVYENRLYVSAGKTLTVFDVSNPAAPMSLGSYAAPGLIWNFRVTRELVYVAADEAGLLILDNPSNGQLALRGSLAALRQARSVAISGTLALVTDSVAGLAYVDIANPARPVQISTAFLEGFATDVVVSGSTVYAADRPAGVYRFDLTKTGNDMPAAMVQSTMSSNRAPAQLEILPASQESPEVVMLLAGGSLQFFDLSKPGAPVTLPVYKTAGNAQRVALVERRAYIADGPPGLQVLDLADPREPRVLGSFKTAMPARDVAVAGSMVFVSIGGGGVAILRASGPSSPR